MKKIQIADMQASQIILGCMRIIEPGKNPVKVIETPCGYLWRGTV